MSEGHISTSDTGYGSRCACGEYHSNPRKLRRPAAEKYTDHSKIVAALGLDPAAVQPGFHPGQWIAAYHGNCTDPLDATAVADRGQLAAHYLVRCRKCENCLKAKRTLWALAAQAQMENSSGRTWFGTLTMRPESREQLQQAVFERWAEQQPEGAVSMPDWLESPVCEHRFSLERDEFKRYAQKYWKRLRKAGHRFKYWITFEQHKDGFPHAHWLLHEGDADRPIRKRALQENWPWGFTKVNLVQGGHLTRSPGKAAFYVAKYITKYPQGRMCASQGYTKAAKQLFTA